MPKPDDKKLAENIKEIAEELHLIRELRELSEDLLETKDVHDLANEEKAEFRRLVRALIRLKIRSILDHLRSKKLEEKRREGK